MRRLAITRDAAHLNVHEAGAFDQGAKVRFFEAQPTVFQFCAHPALPVRAQIQEQTLAIVPKIIAVYVVLVAFGLWILRQTVSFALQLLQGIGEVG